MFSSSMKRKGDHERSAMRWSGGTCETDNLAQGHDAVQGSERKWYHQSRGKKNRNERMVSIVSGDNARPLSYMMEHLGLLGSLTRGWGTGAPCSVCFVLRRLRTRFVKSRSTFWAVLALVSRNSQPNSLAICIPSSRVTSRSSCLSALLPTSMNIGFWRLTLSMDCRKTSRRSKVAREAIEYTRINP
jgi:hypothetical protein